MTVSRGAPVDESLAAVALEATVRVRRPSLAPSSSPKRWPLLVATLVASCVASGSVVVMSKSLEAWKGRRVQAVVSAPVVVRPPARSYEEAEAMVPRKIEAGRLEELAAALAPKRAKKARATEKDDARAMEKDDEVAAAAAILAKAKDERSLD